MASCQRRKVAGEDITNDHLSQGVYLGTVLLAHLCGGLYIAERAGRDFGPFPYTTEDQLTAGSAVDSITYVLQHYPQQWERGISSIDWSAP
jgi:hypothetical protein